VRYKIKWRAGGEEPVSPEPFDGDATAKARVRELLNEYGKRATVEVWNEEETWRIIAPAGIADWCKE
jgi:hypothetical protein